MKSKSLHDNILNLGIILLILYTFVGFIFSKSVIASSTYVYLSFVVLLVLFVVSFLLFSRSGKFSIDNLTVVWLPFLLYTMIAYLLKGDFEHLAYWAICLIIMFLAINARISERIPWKLMMALGCISLAGIFVQIMFPSFYNNHIATFYTNTEQILYWGRAYGFAGFTYQLDVTAMPILYAEGIFRFGVNSDNSEKKWTFKRIVFLILLVIGVFMTGKRMLALLAVVAPVLVILLSQRNQSNKLGFAIAVIALITVGYLYIYNHASSLVSNDVLRRFAESIIKLQIGDSIVTGRDNLYSMAWDAFRSSPIFGIGVSNFVSYTGAYTETHNAYLQVLCEMGVVGFACYVIPLLYCLLSTTKELKHCNGGRRKYIQFSLFCQIVYILYSFSGNTKSNLFGYIIYFLAIAVLIGNRHGRGMNSVDEQIELSDSGGV